MRSLFISFIILALSLNASAEDGAAKSEELTRVRAIGDTEWTMSKRAGGTVKVKARNVGDVEATGVSVSVKINGKEVPLSGPTELAPKKTGEYTYSGRDIVVLGGKYPALATCSNCYR